MFVVMTFFLRSARGLTVQIVIISAFGWTIGGFVFGSLAWWVSERRYRKCVERASDRPAP